MNRVHGNKAKSKIRVKVLVSGYITTATLQAHFHLELAALGDSGNVNVLVENLNVAVGFNHARGDDAGLIGAQIERLRTFARQLKGNLLEVQDDVGCILNDAGDGLELMQHAFNANSCYSSAFNRAQQRATQRIADGGTKAALKGLGAELAIGFGERLGIDCQALRFLKSSPKHIRLSIPARQIRRDAFCGGRASSPSVWILVD